jgi:hypothetical protein
VKRVSGIGGVFVKAKDAAALRGWYRVHLSIAVQEWGGTAFRWRSADNPSGDGTTVWSIFDDTSNWFSPSTSSFMVNDRVENLHDVLAALRCEPRVAWSMTRSRSPRTESSVGSWIRRETAWSCDNRRPEALRPSTCRASSAS